jgi:hypothetical protein
MTLHLKYRYRGRTTKFSKKRNFYERKIIGAGQSLRAGGDDNLSINDVPIQEKKKQKNLKTCRKKLADSGKRRLNFPFPMLELATLLSYPLRFEA